MSTTIALTESPLEAAACLPARRIIAAEFMYRPRPAGGPAQIVFDYTLRARLGALDSRDGVLWIVNSQQTLESLKPLAAMFPDLPQSAVIANPTPLGSEGAHVAPYGWEGNWRQMAQTDRWSRILCAMDTVAASAEAEVLLMPAHDAVYTGEALSALLRLSAAHARGGVPATVSPYTYYQHMAVPGAAIPQDVIGMLNTAFNRDVFFGWKMRLDRVQAFWGKMGMMPRVACSAIRPMLDATAFEDDLHIDSRLRKAGYPVRAWWVADPTLYHQSPPVFTRADVRQVLLRTLHYSLNIPDADGGGSILGHPVFPLGRLRLLSPRYRAWSTAVDALIAECRALIRDRLRQYQASWVDWGGYRYVVRVGYPSVEVWQPV